MLRRILVGGPLLAIVLIFSGLFLAYGEVDPCRVFAVEKARRTQDAGAFDTSDVLERWTRMETSQMTTGECTSALLDSWGERLDRSFPRSRR